MHDNAYNADVLAKAARSTHRFSCLAFRLRKSSVAPLLPRANFCGKSRDVCDFPELAPGRFKEISMLTRFWWENKLASLEAILRASAGWYDQTLYLWCPLCKSGKCPFPGVFTLPWSNSRKGVVAIPSDVLTRTLDRVAGCEVTWFLPCLFSWGLWTQISKFSNAISWSVCWPLTTSGARGRCLDTIQIFFFRFYPCV